jgi:thioredoxin reductase (NADPH)
MSRILSTAPDAIANLAQGLALPDLVVVLCAAWCGTCRDFSPVTERIARRWPEAAFVQLDIEDDSEIAGDIEVENFPTLVVFRQGVCVHFGVSLPQEGVVTRLIAALLEGQPRAVAVAPEVAQLPKLLMQLVQGA